MRFTTALIGAIAAQITGVFADTQATAVQPAQLSVLGTTQAPGYSKFLTNNPLPNGYPWGTATVNNTNPYTSPPNTGKTRYYDLVIARGSIAPDGYNRSSILVNGTYPGPTLEANWGDTFQITVHNKITGPEEPTTLHWHGILQHNTPYEDGVPGVSQCPIAPGTSQVFTFQADLYGTSWYHSHLSAQYAAGVLGPMIIHGPLHHDYDQDLGPVILQDWFHKTYNELVEEVVQPGPPAIPPQSQNQLINGRTNAVFNFTSGTSYRLRLINTAAEGTFVYSIDEHEFTVIAYDFVPIQPFTTKNVTLAVGQRADIIVNATGSKTRSYYMRSTLNGCSVPPDTGNTTALATIFYQNANRNQAPTSTPVSPSLTCYFPSLDIQPAFKITPPSQPATTQQFDITYGNNGTGNTEGTNVFFMNNRQFQANYDEPPLLLANAGNTTYPPSDPWNVYNFGSNSSVRFVVYNHFTAVHPMHLHGHNFWILDQGYGNWSGNVQHADNPQRRDVYMMTGGITDSAGDFLPSYIVIEFNQDNPGVWPFHCHIAWHVSAGLYINVLERPDDIKTLTIPQSVTDTCKGYQAWQAKGNIVDEIDSGERKARKREFVQW